MERNYYAVSCFQSTSDYATEVEMCSSEITMESLWRGHAIFPRVTDPERAELLVCHHAVNLAKELGLMKIALETDCTVVVAKLRDKNRSIHGTLVEEIKASLGELDDFRVLHVRRSGNLVAHKLAKDGCMNKCCNRWVSWVESLPDFVLNLAALNMGN
jgi:hypothetical protein